MKNKCICQGPQQELSFQKCRTVADLFSPDAHINACSLSDTRASVRAHTRICARVEIDSATAMVFSIENCLQQNVILHELRYIFDELLMNF